MHVGFNWIPAGSMSIKTEVDIKPTDAHLHLGQLICFIFPYPPFLDVPGKTGGTFCDLEIYVLEHKQHHMIFRNAYVAGDIDFVKNLAELKLNRLAKIMEEQ